MGRIIPYLPQRGISPAAGFIPTRDNSRYFIPRRRGKISGFILTVFEFAYIMNL
jgi:hypothetical protein